jgi:hypothetical protein
LVFRPTVNQGAQPVKTNVKHIFYFPFEGKVIRTIHIETIDPFDYESEDTTVTPKNFLQKAGNSLHVKTLPSSIKHLLIIKKFDTFDSLRVRESERLIRSQSFVREVFFSPVFIGNSDSVDIYIRVYDIWSVIVSGSASRSSFTIDVQDKNFLGLGHQLENNYHLDHTTGNSLNTTNYYISNIQNTYINTSLHYDIDNKKNYNESCDMERPFYSSLTEWAGGTYFLQHLNRIFSLLPNSSSFLQSYKSNTMDDWIGKSWQLFKGHTENERTTNFILSARYFRTHYLEKPSIDILNIYSDQNFYMIGAGFSKRKYVQDNYIFKYGYTEDVPIGRVYSVIGGYQLKGIIGRWYFGSRFYWGSYYHWGYFSMNMEYGTFVHKNLFEEGTFSVGVNYFSPILNFGRWKFRQFLKSQFIQGFNRLASDNLSLNNELGIRGFNSVGLSGTQKIVLTLQTQSYAPWDILGFRFGPYIVCSMGMLGTESSGFHRSPVYSEFGFGMLIKNEFLLISSFEISVAYFPFMPGVGNNIIKPDPFKTTDFGFRDATIGKPSTVTYQ